MKINAIIMASGLSNRMGKNKLLMKLDNKFIFEIIFDKIKNIREYFYEVIVIASEDIILKSAISFGFKSVLNENSHLGQSVSVKLGIKNSQEVDGYMFCVADQPFIEIYTIKNLLNVFKENSEKIIVPTFEGKNKNPVIFPKSLKDDLLKIDGDVGGRIVIKSNLNKVLRVCVESEDEFIDIDTIQDYVRAVKKKATK